MKDKIAVVWFKKDFRLRDHKPLYEAIRTGLPVLGLHITEPSVTQYGDCDSRHLNFIYQSVKDMNDELQCHFIHLCFGEAIPVFQVLFEHFDIAYVYSHEEIGNHITYQRDLKLKDWFAAHKIVWTEFPTNGIIRGLRNRSNFKSLWQKRMNEPLWNPDYKALKVVNLPTDIYAKLQIKYCRELIHTNSERQPGGERAAYAYLQSFLNDRHSGYTRNISKPYESRVSCSRLSPYLTYGNLSLKQVFAATYEALHQNKSSRSDLRMFISRLHWHDHFIQKFETDCSMEFHNINPGYNSIRNHINEDYLNRWKNGETGYPLVDAAMRCLQHTGYLNFRMRSMLVSFLTHHLWQPWQSGAHHLARLFLDYEPGIHYPQLQMQASTVGVHTIRIYNPIKQSRDLDPAGVFIKRWVPELAECPIPYIHEPWKLPAIEREFLKTSLLAKYPAPVVDIETTGAYAREHLWKMKSSKEVKKHIGDILFRLSDPM